MMILRAEKKIFFLLLSHIFFGEFCQEHIHYYYHYKCLNEWIKKQKKNGLFSHLDQIENDYDDEHRMHACVHSKHSDS